MEKKLKRTYNKYLQGDWSYLKLNDTSFIYIRRGLQWDMENAHTMLTSIINEFKSIFEFADGLKIIWKDLLIDEKSINICGCAKYLLHHKADP